MHEQVSERSISQSFHEPVRAVGRGEHVTRRSSGPEPLLLLVTCCKGSPLRGEFASQGVGVGLIGTVGIKVGAAVGAWVGAAVGAWVGATVGARVGAGA